MSLYMRYYIYTCKMQNKAIHIPTYVDKLVNIPGQNNFKHCD